MAGHERPAAAVDVAELFCALSPVQRKVRANRFATCWTIMVQFLVRARSRGLEPSDTAGWQDCGCGARRISKHK